MKLAVTTRRRVRRPTPPGVGRSWPLRVFPRGTPIDPVYVTATGVSGASLLPEWLDSLTRRPCPTTLLRLVQLCCDEGNFVFLQCQELILALCCENDTPGVCGRARRAQKV